MPTKPVENPPVTRIPNTRKMRSYFANSQTSMNGCGQAAVACVVEYFDRRDLYPGVPRESSKLVDAIYRQHPPDTPGAWVGCTPGHIQNILQNLGFKTMRRQGEAGA